MVTNESKKQRYANHADNMPEPVIFAGFSGRKLAEPEYLLQHV
jgi:hypothetical protein